MNVCCQICFDRFAESGSYEQQNDLDLNSGAWRAEADMLIDLLRSRLTFNSLSCHQKATNWPARIWRFSPIQLRWIAARSALRMLPAVYYCHGLIAGEGAETQGDALLYRVWPAEC